MNTIRTALISVSDKRGVEDFALALHRRGVAILSTGGTARALQARGIPVREVADVTGFPEMLEGRVKTLHPAIHAGILARRDRPDDLAALAERGFQPIDLVVVNLYPFAERVAQGIGGGAALEEIDIGGVTLIRAAAKNFQDVAVVVRPDDYPDVLAELERHGGALTLDTRLDLARRAFQLTMLTDAQVGQFLLNASTDEEGILKSAPADALFPDYACWVLRKEAGLRYGENPHQRAALYRDALRPGEGWGQVEQLHGKELSYNNYLDMDAAWQLATEFDECACVIIKHANPCGAALGDHCEQAFAGALECDPESAFGSIIAFNQPLDGAAAKAMSGLFLEVVIAPGFEDSALEILKRKKNVRLIRRPPAAPPAPGLQARTIEGAVLVQERDSAGLAGEQFRIVTIQEPDRREREDLLFAWKCVKHVKSNAIVIAKDRRLLGIGAGQMSRVDSTRIAIQKARLPLRGAVLGSDAFIPFRDTADLAAAAGVTAIIQPGGSIRDEEVIAAANERALAMAFTGVRHFRH
jgi:phosphoribosylaminoimidazolecarboxamide formyltransferase / IMP cyclohydrolase